jgi:hypothetical protein
MDYKIAMVGKDYTTLRKTSSLVLSTVTDLCPITTSDFNEHPIGKKIYSE